MKTDLLRLIVVVFGLVAFSVPVFAQKKAPAPAATTVTPAPLPSALPPPSPTSQALDAHVAALKAIIDAIDKSATVAPLIAQRIAVQTQLNDLNAKILAAEGPEVQQARRELQALSNPAFSRGGPVRIGQ